MFAQHPHLIDSDGHGKDSELHRTGTYIIQDGEGFGQRFTQQPDPFGKQLVQMFLEMLTRRKNKTVTTQTQPDWICIYLSPASLTVTHIFVGSVSSDQRAIQTRLHIVDLLVILREHNILIDFHFTRKFCLYITPVHKAQS